jgi:hypothetical protein
MKVAIIGDKKNTKSLAMEIAIKCNIPIVVVAKRTFTAEQVLTELNKCKDLMDAIIHFECEDL